MKYLTGEIEPELELHILVRANADALRSVAEGATAPWGDGETLDGRGARDLLRHLDIPTDDERRVSIMGCYDRAFRAAIDASARVEWNWGRE